jgi:hypothetical protein
MMPFVYKLNFMSTNNMRVWGNECLSSKRQMMETLLMIMSIVGKIMHGGYVNERMEMV